MSDIIGRLKCNHDPQFTPAEAAKRQLTPTRSI